MEKFLKLFGQRLAAVRKERGWSQEQLALESGVARSYLSGVERGQRNISLIIGIVGVLTCYWFPSSVRIAM